MEIDKCLEILQKGLTVEEKDVKAICHKANELLAREGQVIEIETPITVCGDIHGQFYDLQELFKSGGDIPSTKYLFLGDLVDRGYYSTETFLLLLTYKIKYPEMIFFVRGNHESRALTLKYGFYKECIRKYGSANVWHYCTETFDFISLSAVIAGKIFCVHGGLSPAISNLDEIRQITKGDLPTNGPASDLVWSDPTECNGWSVSPRGSGYLFGPDVARQFIQRNCLNFICRAHQLAMNGYMWNSNNTVLTVWSAPNYCYRCGNVAAIAKIDEEIKVDLKIFEAAPVEKRGAPYRIPAIFFDE